MNEVPHSSATTAGANVSTIPDNILAWNTPPSFANGATTRTSVSPPQQAQKGQRTSVVGVAGRCGQASTPKAQASTPPVRGALLREGILPVPTASTTTTTTTTSPSHHHHAAGTGNSSNGTSPSHAHGYPRGHKIQEGGVASRPPSGDRAEDGDDGALPSHAYNRYFDPAGGKSTRRPQWTPYTSSKTAHSGGNTGPSSVDGGGATATSHAQTTGIPSIPSGGSGGITATHYNSHRAPRKATPTLQALPPWRHPSDLPPHWQELFSGGCARRCNATGSHLSFTTEPGVYPLAESAAQPLLAFASADTLLLRGTVPLPRGRCECDCIAARVQRGGLSRKWLPAGRETATNKTASTDGTLEALPSVSYFGIALASSAGDELKPAGVPMVLLQLPDANTGPATLFLGTWRVTDGDTLAQVSTLREPILLRPRHVAGAVPLRLVVRDGSFDVWVDDGDDKDAINTLSEYQAQPQRPSLLWAAVPVPGLRLGEAMAILVSTGGKLVAKQVAVAEGERPPESRFMADLQRAAPNVDAGAAPSPPLPTAAEAPEAAQTQGKPFRLPPSVVVSHNTGDRKDGSRSARHPSSNASTSDDPADTPSKTTGSDEHTALPPMPAERQNTETPLQTVLLPLTASPSSSSGSTSHPHHSDPCRLAPTTRTKVAEGTTSHTHEAVPPTLVPVPPAEALTTCINESAATGLTTTTTIITDAAAIAAPAVHRRSVGVQTDLHIDPNLLQRVPTLLRTPHKCWDDVPLPPPPPGYLDASSSSASSASLAPSAPAHPLSRERDATAGEDGDHKDDKTDGEAAAPPSQSFPFLRRGERRATTLPPEKQYVPPSRRRASKHRTAHVHPQSNEKRFHHYTCGDDNDDDDDDDDDEDDLEDGNHGKKATWRNNPMGLLQHLPPGVDPGLAEVILAEVLDRSPGVDWEDIAGVPDAKRLLKEAVLLPLLVPELFTGLVQPWKGVLLYGPPGTGKTMLAKAVAASARTTFFCVSSAVLTDKHYGESEKLVKTLFQVARLMAPSTIFFDEIDAIMSARGGGGEGGSGAGREHEASRRVKSEMLQQMDGVATNSNERVLVLATTNRPGDLDEAIRRRLEKRIYIPLPDRESREAQIRRYASLLNLSPASSSSPAVPDGAVDFTPVVDKTEGYSGADIAIVVRDAAMAPVRRLLAAHSTEEIAQLKQHGQLTVSPVTLQDFLVAVDRVQPSVSQASLKEYAKWSAMFGST